MRASVLEDLMETIERSLDAWLRPRQDLPPALLEAMRYATLGAGKRLRPALAWHASVAAGGQGEDALAAGCAIELVHAFSLVHDDLPALDNDDLRRGKPTLHRYAGEAMAILAGDQLLIEAFALIAEEPGLPDMARAKLLRELASASSRMVYGQVYDTLAGLPDDLDARGRLVLVHRNKTGALIGAACRMGAMSARPGGEARGGAVPAATMAAITRYADAIGLMFQVVDDLIDATQTSEHAGKRTGKDAEQGKLTYPGVLGIEGTRAEVQRLHAESLQALAGLGAQADGLRTLANLMAERTR